MHAEALAKALAGRRIGAGWMARCPAHNDQKPSLSIHSTVDGKALIRCHAGCDQDQVIAVLRARGLWTTNSVQRFVRHAPRVRATHHHDRDDARRTEAALAIWQRTALAGGTPVEAYLAARGWHGASPATLRFHAELKHPSGGVWPSMVSLVTCGPNDTPLAVHRTFLARRGAAKAPVEPAKMMLGPCRGGAVRLAAPTDVLMIGEGIETCLAAMWVTGYPAWAALSVPGLKTLALPDDVRHVIVLADGDAPGERAACECAWRWIREGRRVRIARPPQGLDFNAVLVGLGAGIDGGAQ